MTPRWSRCDIAATVDHAHVASVKSVASGFWPAAGPTRALSVPGRSAPASSSSRDSDLPAFATAGMDGATRVWRLARREAFCGDEGAPSDGSEAARAPFAATRVASVEAHGGSGVRAVAMARTADPAVAALATGSYDGAATVRAWRANAETSASTKPHGGESVLSLAFSPDGAFLVTGAGDGVARVWSARADETRKNSAPLAALAARGFGAVRCVDAAPLREAGEQELMATGGEDGTIRVWSWRACHGLKTARVRVCSSDEGVEPKPAFGAGPDGGAESRLTCELMLKGHARGITAMALCPGFSRGKDGSGSSRAFANRRESRSFRIAAGSDTGAAAAWAFAAADDAETESASSASRTTRESSPTTRRLAFGAAHTRGGVRACAFTPVEADVLASASEDRTVRLWDLQTGTCLCALTGARAAAECVAFSPDAAFLFAGAADGSLAAWRDASGSGGARADGRSNGGARTGTVRADTSSDRQMAFAVAVLDARVTLGLRALLAPPPDPAVAAAAERRGGAVGVDAACVASADAAAREDAEAFLPRVDASAIARLVLRASEASHSGVLDVDDARIDILTGNEPLSVSCAICREPVRFSVGGDARERARARRDADWCMPLPCGHAFHARACILPWLTRGETTCPLCRRRVVGGGERRRRRASGRRRARTRSERLFRNRNVPQNAMTSLSVRFRSGWFSFVLLSSAVPTNLAVAPRCRAAVSRRRLAEASRGYRGRGVLFDPAGPASGPVTTHPSRRVVPRDEDVGGCRCPREAFVGAFVPRRRGRDEVRRDARREGRGPACEVRASASDVRG